MALHHFRHQAVGRATHRHDLLKQRCAAGPSLDRTLKRFGLAPDTTNASDGPTFLLWCVWHQIFLFGAEAYYTGDMFIHV